VGGRCTSMTSSDRQVPLCGGAGAPVTEQQQQSQQTALGSLEGRPAGAHRPPTQTYSGGTCRSDDVTDYVTQGARRGGRQTPPDTGGTCRSDNVTDDVTRGLPSVGLAARRAVKTVRRPCRRRHAGCRRSTSTTKRNNRTRTHRRSRPT